MPTQKKGPILSQKKIVAELVGPQDTDEAFCDRSKVFCDNVDDLLEEDAFMTLDEVAGVLHCSRRVVYDWTRRPDPERRPPFFQPGKTILFPRRRFMRWLVTEQMKGAQRAKGGVT